MLERVTVRVERDEVDEAVRELDYWRPRLAGLPAHIRARISELETERPDTLFRVVAEPSVVTLELTPTMRALVGTLRAYR